MGNRMQNNFEAVKHPTGSLKESVDNVRVAIRDLYELDEDNYQMIKNVQRALDETNNRVNAVTRKSNGKFRRLGIAGLLLTGLVYFGGKAIKAHNQQIEELKAKINVLQGLNESEEKAEESDG